MASNTHQLHFVLFPLLAQGHMIPMIDLARLLALRGVTITIITTPLWASRFRPVLDRSVSSGLHIQLIEIHLPYAAAGLPKGCEDCDTLPSPDFILKIFKALEMLRQPVEQLFRDLNPTPSCVISDVCLPFTSDVARKFNIPRIAFHGTSCFSFMCIHAFRRLTDSDKSINTSESNEKFVLPGLPDRLEFKKSQLPAPASPEMVEWFEKWTEADLASYGVVVNSFDELEPAYVKEYRKIKAGRRVWTVGPVSLCNTGRLDLAQRGDKASADETNKCLKWLDLQEPSSVIYICLGSLCNLSPPQLKELAQGLEDSKKPFIWVVRGGQLQELDKWLSEQDYEKRVRGRGMLIRGWAPQVLILSNPSIGGFLTHCGWNSTLEGISAGVPLLTWPMFGDQFCNEKLAVEVLRVGVRVRGAEDGEGVMVGRENVKKGVEEVMEGGEEGRERRERAKRLAVKARNAMDGGASSNVNLTQLIHDVSRLICDGKMAASI